jgi:hypothetical protein
MTGDLHMTIRDLCSGPLFIALAMGLAGCGGGCAGASPATPLADNAYVTTSLVSDRSDAGAGPDGGRHGLYGRIDSAVEHR